MSIGNVLFAPVDDERSKKHLLRKLSRVFKDGYRPARGAESYNVRLDNGFWAYQQVNCLGHVFNLRNQQFNDYNFLPIPMFGFFPQAPWEDNHDWARKMLAFIQATGLQVEECDPVMPITDFRSWKTALYFSQPRGWGLPDFHFLLEDAPRQWSSKCGNDNAFEQFYHRTAPQEYQCCTANSDTHCLTRDPDTYYLYNTYKITNPNADPNNPYVKDHYAPERGL